MSPGDSKKSGAKFKELTDQVQKVFSDQRSGKITIAEAIEKIAAINKQIDAIVERMKKHGAKESSC